jgi:pilus assembly protein CpaF
MSLDPAAVPPPLGDLPLFLDERPPLAGPTPPPVRARAPEAAPGRSPGVPGVTVGATPRTARAPSVLDAVDVIDWQQVRILRAAASDRLTTVLTDREGTLTPAAQRELGRTIILELLDAEARAALTRGRPPLGMATQQAIAQAVHDALFGLGRLQPLVDDERVENIEVNGHDNVTLQLEDGSRHPGPPVADSDDELLDFLSFLASRSLGNARPFSPARPTLHMTLDGGARLAATAWITPRPVLVIRRHRLRVVRLEDLVARRMLSPLAASFLAAAIRDRRSVVVSGPQGAGKTTLVRALADVLPAWERIGTFETEYELFLHELPGRYSSVAAWEARPGSGERGPDGRPAGEITLDDCLYDSFRFNLDRQIVGEVRGREVLAMFKAMQSGAGSISTTHAATAVGAIQKLITCALEAGPQVTVAYAERVVAEHIHLIVQLAMDVWADPATGQPVRRRRVSEIIAVHPGEAGPAHTHVFRTGAHPEGDSRRDPPLVPGVLPDDYRRLVTVGFDLGEYVRQVDATRALVPR